MVELDPAFIQPLQHRPNPQPTQALNIPLIDLATSRSHLVSQIGDACRDWGFFQVINHGVDPERRRRAESASREFFALPAHEKAKVGRDEGNPFGYYDGEHTKNVRDWKQVFDFSVLNPVVFPASHEADDLGVKELFTKWPDQTLPQLREAFEEYTQEMEKLAFKLMGYIALSLGLPQDRFRDFFKDQTSRVRLNYYPPCPAPHLALGVGRHKDTGVLTILAQDNHVCGLEVKRKTDGAWLLVKPVPDAYIINIGDIIQVWSNDAYESVEHRVVVNSNEERFSIPYFLYPAHYTWVEPLPELVSTQNPPKFNKYNWGKFRATRNRGNFKKLDVDNIQISHFRI